MTTPYERMQQKLREKLSRPGGLTAESAVARGETAITTMRPYLLSVLNDEIAQLVKLVPPDGRIDRDVRGAIGARARVVYNLAGTCDLDPLRRVVASLMDLLTLFEGRSDAPGEPFGIHARAALYMSPRGGAVSANEAACVLADLGKLATHFGHTEMGPSADRLHTKEAAQTAQPGFG